MRKLSQLSLAVLVVGLGTHAAEIGASGASPTKTPPAGTLEIAPGPDQSLLARPATEALVDLARQDFRAGNLSKENQDSVQSGLRATDPPISVERMGSAGRYLEKKRSWRALADLINPFAPTTRPEQPAAMAFETRQVLDYSAPDSLRGSGGPPVPRAFRDPIRQESGIRLW